MKIESQNALQVECETMPASFGLRVVGLHLRTATKRGGRSFRFRPPSSCLPLSLLFSLFSSFLSQSFLSLSPSLQFNFQVGVEGNFSFHSGNKLVCYLKVVKEKLEKLSMVLGVGALYNFHATSIYEH